MSDPLSFQELLQRARVGDQDAARTLVQRYEPAIRRAVRLRLADSRLASLLDSMDICQSVLASFFVRAAAGQYDIEQPDQLLRLLVAMARNKLAVQARAQQRQRRDHRRNQAAGPGGVEFVAHEASPSQEVAGRELLGEAQRLLSPEERRLVELRQEGLEWAAIAERLGGTPEALRKQLARAVDRVAHQLHLDDYRHE
jgi:RNA polymerase sigma-70 factor (ECF subfamily)